MCGKQTIIHWFRKGLRIHDNPALKYAVDKVISDPKKYELRPIFVLDPDIVKWLKVGPNRWRFLMESLESLNKKLTGINSRLYVVRGNPIEVFPKLFKDWNASLLTFEGDIEPYAIKRDTTVQNQAKEAKVDVKICNSHTIFDPEAVVKKNAGKAPLTYAKYQSLVLEMKMPAITPDPSKVPEGCTPHKNNLQRYHLPTLEELIVDTKRLGPNKFPGGEIEALRRMDENLKRKAWICAFEKPNTSPNSLEPSTTVLSPYLKFGCLSSRLFYLKTQEVIKGQKHSKPPTSLLGQLLWREFYYCVAAVTPNFDKMLGNTVCVQIPWDTNKEHLEAWTNGKTGYPFIDAIMRQLRQEGWIHHLARHAVACFLTRGDLWISWEEGQKVFEELLLDADWALNAGNWMWLSASAFFHQFFRVYSPVAFGKKTDPEGKFIKKYVPELAKFPSGIIYEPWKANMETQKKLGCIIGKDYPKRIVVHEDISKVNIGKMSAAYKKNKEMKESGNGKAEKKETAKDKRKRSPEPSASPSPKVKKVKGQKGIAAFLTKK